MYSTRVHVRISNGHPREENRAACRTSRRGSLCVFGSWRTKLGLFLWQAEQGSRRTRRHTRDDPRAEVGEDVCVGVRVRVGAVECQLTSTTRTTCCEHPREDATRKNASVEFKLYRECGRVLVTRSCATCCLSLAKLVIIRRHYIYCTVGVASSHGGGHHPGHHPTSCQRSLNSAAAGQQLLT